ncbi:hypothetical protein L21SP3_00963 [Sedimentisphaera cyanobacteriorum]|uniref:Uncharacterized protein n=1 Tax=Sedimentisphaera cyanobacteriorum TaxID=1940790 RepID=A0A1Q2HPK6_9BACT|nr:hypothetical protein L21SP3_00963 [Sedimentisphaera cyanobacteriorum]
MYFILLSSGYTFATVFLGLLVFIRSYDYFMFFHSPVWHEHFWNYQSILSAPKWY